MQHKWQDKDNISYNFCIKCGIKKSRTYRHHCIMSNENWQKDLPHILKNQYEIRSRPNHWQGSCSVCESTYNRGYSSFALCTLDENDAHSLYVPYIEEIFLSKKKRKYVYRWFKRTSMDPMSSLYGSTIMVDKKDRVVKFYKIGCAYTEEENMIKNIII